MHASALATRQNRSNGQSPSQPNRKRRILDEKDEFIEGLNFHALTPSQQALVDKIQTGLYQIQDPQVDRAIRLKLHLQHQSVTTNVEDPTRIYVTNCEYRALTEAIADAWDERHQFQAKFEKTSFHKDRAASVVDRCKEELNQLSKGGDFLLMEIDSALANTSNQIQEFSQSFRSEPATVDDFLDLQKSAVQAQGALHDEETRNLLLRKHETFNKFFKMKLKISQAKLEYYDRKVAHSNSIIDLKVNLAWFSLPIKEKLKLIRNPNKRFKGNTLI